MKLYREVKAKDKLPPVPGYYTVRDIDNPYRGFTTAEYEGEKISGAGWKLKYVWLDPIEISEEEIEEILIKCCEPDMRTYNSETGRAVFRILETDCDKAAQAIIKHIKRE